MMADNALHVRVASWLLRRRLYRRPVSDGAAVLVKILVIRVCAASCAFASMLLAAWIGAFARTALEHGWSGFRTLNDAALRSALAQAARYDGDLIPVLTVWAVLLVLTPAGYSLAFRAAEVAAGALGALHVSPPSFVITREVAGFSRGISAFDLPWNGILLLIASICAVYLLHSGALGVFDQFSAASRPSSRPGSPARVRAGQACAAVLALVVLLAANWTAAVVWRVAASPVAGNVTSYGLQGGQVQSRWLLVLVAVAVLISLSRNPQGGLTAGIVAAMLLGAVGFEPHIPDVSVGQGALASAGSAWGAASVWAALFLYFPCCLLGVYLSARLRPAREERF